MASSSTSASLKSRATLHTSHSRHGTNHQEGVEIEKEHTKCALLDLPERKMSQLHWYMMITWDVDGGLATLCIQMPFPTERCIH